MVWDEIVTLEAQISVKNHKVIVLFQAYLCKTTHPHPEQWYDHEPTWDTDI